MKCFSDRQYAILTTVDNETKSGARQLGDNNYKFMSSYDRIVFLIVFGTKST